MMSTRKQLPRKAGRLDEVVRIDTAEIQQHMDQVVWDTMGEMLNNLLEADVDRMCLTERYERAEVRTDIQAITGVAGLASAAVPAVRLTLSHFAGTHDGAGIFSTAE